LYLTIKNIYLDEMRRGLKNVEYRNNTEFFRRKLFVKDKDGNPSKQMKPLKYLLFQGGYEADSPRVLIELKGWTIGLEKFPKDLNCKGFTLYPDLLCLLLGEIVYDSQEGRLYFQQSKVSKKVAKLSKSKAAKSLKDFSDTHGFSR